jgi:glycosyltransferase involved in cell wall biosynthesis
MTDSAFPYTVVVPCYNNQRTIGKVLDSIGALQPPPDEVIVIDDHSTDQTVALVSARENVILIVNDRNQGASAARNRGAKGAGTPYLLFIDSDCYLDPAGFTAAIELLQRRADLIGVMGVFSPAGPSSSFVGTYKNLFRHHEIIAMHNPPPIFNSSCFFMRRDAYLDIDGFKEDFGKIPTEDNEFYFRLVERRHVMEYLPAFSFFHDKPMHLSQLFMDDMRRAKAIVMNLTGKLGAPRRTWESGERGRWILELLTANAIAALLLLICLGGLISSTLVYFSGILLLLAGALMTYLNRRPLMAAMNRHGLGYFLGVLSLRIVELLAASLGIALAIPALFAAPRLIDR